MGYHGRDPSGKANGAESSKKSRDSGHGFQAVRNRMESPQEVEARILRFSCFVPAVFPGYPAGAANAWRMLEKMAARSGVFQIN
jgi:hypothetical protein